MSRDDENNVFGYFIPGAQCFKRSTFSFVLLRIFLIYSTLVNSVYASRVIHLERIPHLRLAYDRKHACDDAKP